MLIKANISRIKFFFFFFTKKQLPENCQIHVLGFCHQISSCHPKVHHQPQQELLTVGMNYMELKVAKLILEPRLCKFSENIFILRTLSKKL